MKSFAVNVEAVMCHMVFVDAPDEETAKKIALTDEAWRESWQYDDAVDMGYQHFESKSVLSVREMGE